MSTWAILSLFGVFLCSSLPQPCPPAFEVLNSFAALSSAVSVFFIRFQHFRAFSRGFSPTSSISRHSIFPHFLFVFYIFHHFPFFIFRYIPSLSSFPLIFPSFSLFSANFPCFLHFHCISFNFYIFFRFSFFSFFLSTCYIVNSGTKL